MTANGNGYAWTHDRRVGGCEMPGYWMHETTGVLRPAIEAYLHGDEMTGEQIAAMRAYIRQWINAPVWVGGEDIEALRRRVDELTDREAIAAWLFDAEEACIDPL